jgi:c-di-GMP-binding flagellar brake protein YcgR
MHQIAQLSESEIEERFHITAPTAIVFLLAGFAEQKESFTVQFAEGREHFLTTLLAVDEENAQLIIDCSGSIDLNQQFPQSRRNYFVARPAGIQVQFSSGPARLISFEGAPAFAVALPAFIMRLQRREFFRIETAHVNPLLFHARLPDQSLLTLPAHDLSVAGIGLVSERDPAFSQGLDLKNCHFRLPDEGRAISLQATVRHSTMVMLRAGVSQWRIGLQFSGLPSAEENRLQRYIAQLELERHELV